MSNLPGQHGDLATVMRIVSDQISEKSGDIRSKILHSAVCLQGMAHDFVESLATSGESCNCRWRSNGSAIELVRNFAELGSLKPHDPNVVHVGDDRSGGAPPCRQVVWRPTPRMEDSQ